MSNPLTNAVSEALDLGRPTGDDDGREEIDNRERGCGHLKSNSCYVRCDVAALSSAKGEIPRFVELDDPVEYRENNGKGAIIPSFEYFPGESFSAHYEADGRSTTPEGDIRAHFDRLFRYGFDGDHFGDITSCHAHDILMSVGKTNWETPDDFIQECRDRGLNLKIGVSNRSPPPVVEPLRTRVWVIHPHGAGEGRPAIIGYSYLTRNVFTTGTKATNEDPDIPKWAENYAKTRDDFDVVDRGEPIAEDDPAFDPSQTRLADHDEAKKGVEAAREALGTPVDDDPFDSEDRVDQIDDGPEYDAYCPTCDHTIDDADVKKVGGSPVDGPSGYECPECGTDVVGKSTEVDEDTDHYDTRSSGDQTDRDVATLSLPSDDDREVTGLEVEFGRGDVVPGAAAASFYDAIDDGPLTYNALKVIASNRDEVDAGSTPSTDDLVGALVKDAGAFVPAYVRDDPEDPTGGSNE